LAAGLEFLKNSDFRTLLDSINVPSLIMQGEKDHVTEKSMAEYLAGKLKKCDYRVVPGTGHSLPIEKGRGCAIAIEDFLKSNKMM
jgi:pimeloyl-ACP methyl ester carboxylesterase